MSDYADGFIEPIILNLQNAHCSAFWVNFLQAINQEIDVSLRHALLGSSQLRAIAAGGL
jgi:hypothetical protein